MMSPQQAMMMGGRGQPMMGQAAMMGMMRPGMPGMMMGGKGMPGMTGMAGMMPGGMMPGGMRPGMMPQMGARPAGPAAGAQQMPQPSAAQPQAAAAGGTGQPLSASALAAAPPSVQKQMIGEKLFPLIAKYQPELAGKITGMMLEMDNSELLILLESEQQMKSNASSTLRVLGAPKP